MPSFWLHICEQEVPMDDRRHFLFLNIGHFLDHLFLLIFATAAALTLASEWALSYGDLIPYATPGLIAFGLFSLPAGWLADRWSREGMMAVFFVGIGGGSNGHITGCNPA
jgi:MFS family permease